MLLSGLPALGQDSALGNRGAKSPNILLILCDDLGRRDLSCFGNARVATPNVDRLAIEGARLLGRELAAWLAERRHPFGRVD